MFTRSLAVPEWTLDCAGCGRLGQVVLSQDVDTGDLIDADGTRAHEFTCTGCGSGDDLVPTVLDRPLIAFA